MKDEPEGSTSDEEAAVSGRRGQTEVAPDHSVPADAEWTQVAQKPVGESPTSGLTMAIISAVADAEGVQPVEITDPPLFDVLDTAALEAAFVSSGDLVHLQDEGASTEFMYRGYRIMVQCNGWVRVFERSDN